MSSSSVPELAISDQVWRSLYMAALFETDRGYMSQRITEAERAIVVRARELFFLSNQVEQEQRSLESALQALRALQSCLKPRVRSTGAAA